MLASLLVDIKVAAIFLTRLPLAWPAGADATSLNRAMRLFPLVGAALGLAGAALQALALWLGAPPLVAALLALALMALLTGALHEDGLADTADGFGARADRTRTLAIMRDSRIGAFGAIALVLVLMLRATALAAIGAAWLVLPAAEAAGRAAAPVLMAWLPAARAEGLSARVGTVGRATAGIAALIAAPLVLAALGPLAGLAGLLLAAAGVAGLGALATARIQGQTGDVAGTAILLAGTAILLAASAQ
jgi:adenosylcobinamide-GDP ribazoletransferase